MLRVFTLAEWADRVDRGAFGEVARVHVFVEYDALRSAVARRVVGGNFSYSSDEFNVDVVPVVGGVVIHASVEICFPAMMVDVALNVGEKGLVIV
jgi:hypothetical protein